MCPCACIYVRHQNEVSEMMNPANQMTDLVFCLMAVTCMRVNKLIGAIYTNISWSKVDTKSYWLFSSSQHCSTKKALENVNLVRVILRRSEPSNPDQLKDSERDTKDQTDVEIV